MGYFHVSLQLFSKKLEKYNKIKVNAVIRINFTY